MIKQTISDQDKKITEDKISIQRAKYNEARYPTKHLLKENVQRWMNYKKMSYKERTNRAIDVLAPYIINNDISFEDLLNGKKKYNFTNVC